MFKDGSAHILQTTFNPLTPNELQKRRTLNPLKIKIPSTKSRQAALCGGI
jgi:hypothetical protein